MANFIFNWAAAALQAATLDLSTGNYYAHLVTTIPALGHATVADLVLPTTGGYTSTPLTGLSYNSTRWTFDSFNFPKYSFVSAPTGVVICKRSGASPATTDGIICYSDFNNSIGQVINLSVGAYVVNLQFGSSGAINFSYRYQYSSGAYANTETFPKGLIWLIGSQNNTIAFSNPRPLKISVNTSGTSNEIFNRGAVGSNFGSGTKLIGIDFGSLLVRAGKVGIYDGFAGDTGRSIIVSGSNNIGISSNWNNSSLYTTLQSITGLTWSTSWQLVNCTNNTTFYRYYLIQIQVNGNSGLEEIEFYESSALSPTQNFV